jgi:hypothetical protein
MITKFISTQHMRSQQAVGEDRQTHLLSVLDQRKLDVICDSQLVIRELAQF